MADTGSDAERGGLTLVGNYGATAVALAPSLTAGLTDPLDSADGTPLEPIADAISAAIRNAARQFDVLGSLQAGQPARRRRGPDRNRRGALARRSTDTKSAAATG